MDAFLYHCRYAEKSILTKGHFWYVQNGVAFFYFFDLIGPECLNGNCMSTCVDKFHFETRLIAMHHSNRTYIAPKEAELG